MPRKPMIRLATPIFGDGPKAVGIVVINYTAGILLDHFVRASAVAPVRPMLLNADGYWLKGDTADDEWGFMFPPQGNDITFAKRYPAAWKTINTMEIGQATTGQGLFIFSTVFPLMDFPERGTCLGEDRHWFAKAYHWIVVAHLNQATRPENRVHESGHGAQIR